MAYKIKIEGRAKKQLNNIPAIYQDKFVRAIDSLQINPFRGKKLEGKLKGHYSIRVWPYRVIYSVYKSELIISIIDIGHRKDVYR